MLFGTARDAGIMTHFHLSRSAERERRTRFLRARGAVAPICVIFATL